MQRLHRLRFSAILTGLLACALTGSTAWADGPTTRTFPYGKGWQGNRYGPDSGWWSGGVAIGTKPSRITIDSNPRSQFLFSVETRYHISPRMAVLLGAHFAGHQVSSSDKAFGVKYDTMFRYHEGSWQTGLDLSLWETKLAHLQCGPRLGIQVLKGEITLEVSQSSTTEAEDLANEAAGTGWVHSADPFVGAAARLGFFPTPSVEVGLHTQLELIYGGQEAAVGYTPGLDQGLELSLYTVVHF